MKPINRKVVVIGGGTFSHVRSHLALAAPAFGETARKIAGITREKFSNMDTNLYLTRMATNKWENCPVLVKKDIVTNLDLLNLVQELKSDLSVKIIFFNAAACDFDGKIDNVESGKYADRLKTKDSVDVKINITPSPKMIKSIRDGRKDIFLVAFKTTAGATENEQYLAGLDLLKKNSCNLVLANDIVTRKNMIITPEEARYHITDNREFALQQLVEMTWLRSHLTFTRSTVVAGTPIPWTSNEVFPSLRTVVDYCIDKRAYKPFNGATVGHFACKVGPTTFLTSIRKSDFNHLKENGLVKVETDGDDSVIAYGAKPSVGGQSQRIVFTEHPDYDCIVHFHCPIKENSKVPTISQREYECGSHQCGQNTSNGLQKFGNLSAVMLDNHGPNIVFNHNVDPQEVIDFIENNFDLSDKTGGLVTL